MNRVISATLGFLILVCAASAQFEDPFSVTVKTTEEDGENSLSVSLVILENHYVYADKVSIESEPVDLLTPERIPAPKVKHDELLGKTVEIFDSSVEFVYRISPGTTFPFSIEVAYQGCSIEPMICFIPARKKLQVSGIDVVSDTGEVPAETDGSDGLIQENKESAKWRTIADKFEIAGVAGGFLDVSSFLAFLDDPSAGGAASGGGITSGIWLTLLGIFLYGIALNLTPCVLPMIPINLAIIGAGAQASSKGKGVLLGALYGLGITVAYGALGVVVVLTGAMFGTLTASPWFNAIITAVFVVVGMAMFDVFAIDLSRFQPQGGGTGKTSLVLVPVLGALSAVLAGACVAPILLTALALAVDLYSRGNSAGLLVPFLLGLGMAVPWPFAGGGLSVLPKPGKWMEHVKHALGIIVLLLALLYGYKAYKGFTWKQSGSLAEGLERALDQNKPVLLDFWASWCTSCKAMDKTTFKDARVQDRLKGFEFVKYQMEDPSVDEAAEVREYFKIQGLPSYVVLQPAKSDG